MITPRQISQTLAYCFGLSTNNQALAFATDTSAGVAKGAMRVAFGGGGAICEDILGGRAYTHPGDQGGTGYHNQLDGFHFSINTTASIAKGVTSQQLAYSSLTHKNGLGMWRLCGSASGSDTGVTDHIPFATETATAVAKGTMPTATSSCSGTQA